MGRQIINTSGGPRRPRWGAIGAVVAIVALLAFVALNSAKLGLHVPGLSAPAGVTAPAPKGT